MVGKRNSVPKHFKVCVVGFRFCSNEERLVVAQSGMSKCMILIIMTPIVLTAVTLLHYLGYIATNIYIKTVRVSQNASGVAHRTIY